MKKILVTGGAGFIGSHLVDELLSRGHFVKTIDNLSNGNLENLASAIENKNFQFYKGDILNPFDCMDAAKDCDFIFHLACLGVRHSLHSPIENHEVNARGTLNVLEASRKNQIKKFYYISTSEVYGETKEFPITEKSPTYPTTVYGASKLAGENYAFAYRKSFGMNVNIFRIFNNYGPRAHYEGDSGEIIPRSIVNILYGKQPILYGDGTVTRDFFFVKDTAYVLSDLLEYDLPNGELINIGNGKEITIKELILSLLKLMGGDELGIKYLDSRPADVPRLWVDNAKFYSFTKFQSKINFNTGLNYTIEYYKDLMKKKNLISSIKEENWHR